MGVTRIAFLGTACVVTGSSTTWVRSEIAQGVDRDSDANCVEHSQQVDDLLRYGAGDWWQVSRGSDQHAYDTQ